MALDDFTSMAMLGAPNTNTLSRTLMQMRMLRNEEMMSPRTQSMRGGGGSNPFMAQMAGGGGPNYSQFTYDPNARAQANASLGQYGLSALSPEQVNPFTIFPNKGFFGNHPGITNALEGGIYGGAMTRGANTWGEGISNVMQGMIAGPQARNAMWQRQFAAPFQSAQALEGLQDMQQKRELNEADIQWRRAEAQKALQGNPLGTGLESGLIQQRFGARPLDPTKAAAWDKQVEDFHQTFNEDKRNSPNPLGPGEIPAAIRARIGDPPPAGDPKADAYWKQHDTLRQQYEAASSKAQGPFQEKIVEAQIGPMPTDPAKKAAWGKKAEGILNNMAFGKAEGGARGSDTGHDPARVTKMQRDWQVKQDANRQAYVAARSKADTGGFRLQMEQSLDHSIKSWGDVYDRDVKPSIQEPDWDSMGGSPMPSGSGPKLLKFDAASGTLK